MLSLVLSTLVHGTTIGLAFGYGAQPVMGGLLVNLASSSLWALGERWRDGFGRIFNAELHINDDLLAALARGLRRALALGQKQYAEEWNTIAHQGVRNAIKELDALLKRADTRDSAALDEIKGSLNKHTLGTLVHSEGNEPDQVLQSLLPALDAISDSSQRSATEAWLRRVILRWAALLFFDELKKNDAAGTAAWRAYSDLIFTRFGAKLDTLISSVDAVAKAQQELAEAAKRFGDGKAAQEALRQEMAPLLAQAITDAVMCSSAKEDILALFDLTTDEFKAFRNMLDLLLAQGKASAESIAELKHLLREALGRIPKQQSQRLSPPKFIHHAAEHFLGREPQLALLDEAWANGTNVLSIIAWGGVGKTALITEWVQTRFIDKQWKTDDGQPALDAYFDWTFYDQGTRSLADGTEARTGSVGDFFEQALVFFGDPDPNLPGKGRRLADLIRQQRSLIILDGLEPLQQPPGHPQAGRLLDPDLRDLLAALAQSNPGLCVITSRQALTDLHSLRRTIHTEHELEDLPVAIAIRLLRQLQIKGTDQELAEASEKFGCHALSLTLLGRYLFDAHGGDIARTDRIRDLQRADTLTREDRHRTAWRILETYESWLATAQADGNPKTLAVLRLTGLFDRTATADCLAALRAAPIIPGLTNAICGMADDEWNILLKRLERTHLIKLRNDPDLIFQIADQRSIDAHPLIREYFAKHLKQTQPEAFKAAHSRLFDYLTQNTEFQPSTLHELQPLYQAISHGCLADRYLAASRDVLQRRITRATEVSNENFSIFRLGATSSDLGALQCFFDQRWLVADPQLPAEIKDYLLGEAAFRLSALGLFSESEDTLIRGLFSAQETGNWRRSAVLLNNLAEWVQMWRGELESACASAIRANWNARKAKSDFWRMACAATAGHLHSMRGRQAQAHSWFRRALRFKRKINPSHQELQSCSGNDYCLAGYYHQSSELVEAERTAWRFAMDRRTTAEGDAVFVLSDRDSLINTCNQVQNTANISLGRVQHMGWLLDTALDNLLICQTYLYHAATLSMGHLDRLDLISSASFHVETSIRFVREAGQQPYVPLALLTAAFYHGTLGVNLEEAERLLEEAQQIAERGPMPLYLADVHLHRARLFGRMNADERRQKFPDINPKAELAEARRLIEKHGYWRRKEELEDAEAAAVNW